MADNIVSDVPAAYDAVADAAHSGESRQIQASLPIDALTAKTAQLRAMLCIIYGDAYEAFMAHHDEIKHHYFWACAEMSNEIDSLASQIVDILQSSDHKGADHA